MNELTAADAALTAAFRETVPDAVRDHLLVTAARRGVAGNVAGVTITFKSGGAFCCFEPGCHFPWADGAFGSLRRVLASRDVAAPFPLVLHIGMTVEAGTTFGSGPIARAMHFERSIDEGGEPLMSLDAYRAAGGELPGDPAIASARDIFVRPVWWEDADGRPFPGCDWLAGLGDNDNDTRRALTDAAWTTGPLPIAPAGVARILAASLDRPPSDGLRIAVPPP